MRWTVGNSEKGTGVLLFDDTANWSVLEGIC